MKIAMKVLALLTILGSTAQAAVEIRNCPNYSALLQIAKSFNVLTAPDAQAMNTPEESLVFQGRDPKSGRSCEVKMEGMGWRNSKSTTLMISTYYTNPESSSIEAAVPWENAKGDALENLKMQGGKLVSVVLKEADSGDHNYVPLIPVNHYTLSITAKGSGYLFAGSSSVGLIPKGSVNCLVQDMTTPSRKIYDANAGLIYACH